MDTLFRRNCLKRRARFPIQPFGKSSVQRKFNRRLKKNEKVVSEVERKSKLDRTGNLLSELWNWKRRMKEEKRREHWLKAMANKLKTLLKRLSRYLGRLCSLILDLPQYSKTGTIRLTRIPRSSRL